MALVVILVLSTTVCAKGMRVAATGIERRARTERDTRSRAAYLARRARVIVANRFFHVLVANHVKAAERVGLQRRLLADLAGHDLALPRHGEKMCAQMAMNRDSEGAFTLWCTCIHGPG